jgi:hypothetical protein
MVKLRTELLSIEEFRAGGHRPASAGRHRLKLSGVEPSVLASASVSGTQPGPRRLRQTVIAAASVIAVGFGTVAVAPTAGASTHATHGSGTRSRSHGSVIKPIGFLPGGGGSGSCPNDMFESKTQGCDEKDIQKYGTTGPGFTKAQCNKLYDEQEKESKMNDNAFGALAYGVYADLGGC